MINGSENKAVSYASEGAAYLVETLLSPERCELKQLTWKHLPIFDSMAEGCPTRSCRFPVHAQRASYFSNAVTIINIYW